MFLYFLVGMLWCSESLTSVEVFDVFNFSLDAAMDDKPSETFFSFGANSTAEENNLLGGFSTYGAAEITTNSTSTSNNNTKCNENCTNNTTKTNESPYTSNNYKSIELYSNENLKENQTTFSTNSSTTDTTAKHWIYAYKTIEQMNNNGRDQDSKFENITKKYGTDNETIVFADILPLVMGGQHFNNKSGTLPSFHIPLPTACPEEEAPDNIGAYEVPTKQDVVLHLRNHLLAMYQGFHFKAMHFLKDIKQATRASWSRKMYCRGPTELMQYRRCVRWVGDMSELTTKSLVSALEAARRNITAFMQGKICNISSLNVDPIHLIRILAAEKVSLEFALPDFLRQLDACVRYCPRARLIPSQQYLERTRLTDKDFVVRHYLTQENYNHQLSQHYKF